MADGPDVWSRAQGVKAVDPNEKLFLFGYSCKLFPDDEKALYIEQGKHLIPWMGDENLMIDRYDVRGYLHDLKQYEPKQGECYEDSLSEEDKLCDEERYRSLRTDLSEEQLYQEEELKRLRAAIASDGAYHEIGFTYDNVENEDYEKPAASKVEEPEDELYEAPQGLHVPKGMEVPYNMKIHAIIEKTAVFVSEQGGQMEIIIKMKQHANPQFAFMHLDNPLYPYYKHLVKVIKSGSYKPVQIKKESRSEDEDDDGHYLHPSLMSGRAETVPKFTVPSINFRRSHDDSYSILVRNLQQHIAEEVPIETSEQQVFDSPAYDDHYSANYSSDGTTCVIGYQNDNVISVVHHVVPPPPDIQPIIHKMAEYVAKNGEDFEIIVKTKNDKRFAFLNPSSEYYSYYIQKRNEAKQLISVKSEQSEEVSEHLDSNNASQNKQLSNNTSQNVSVPENTLQNTHCSGTPSQNTVSNDAQITNESDVAEVPSVVTSEENILILNAAPSPSDIKENDGIKTSAVDEFDALYTQDSQDAVFTSEPEVLKTTLVENTDSIDFLDSPETPKTVKEEVKSKPSKVLKGPISFSLKMKECDSTSSDKTKMTPLLMDDSDEDSTEESKREKVEPNKRRRSTDDVHTLQNSRNNSVEREEKVPKLSSDFLEAKMAEERIKDKLLAAARERLAQQKKEKQLQLEQQRREEQLKKDKQMQLDQQRKEKQLQLERKRKAALFLKMLKSKNPDLDIDDSKKSDKRDSHDKASRIASKFGSEFWSLSDTSGILSPENGILFPPSKMSLSSNNLPMTIPGIKTVWSSNSNSGESGEEEFITEYGGDTEVVKNVPEKQEEKHEHKKKKKKRSRSKSKERKEHSRSSDHSKSSRTKERHRSPARNHRQERYKKDRRLPAAYAFVTRSRSRSRSPRRHRPSPAHWNRRR